MRKRSKKVIEKLVNSNEKNAATAGCLFVKNAKKSFVTKLQEWDYTLGIFGVKLIQGNYNSTLVAQGSFSAYKTALEVLFFTQFHFFSSFLYL